VLASKTTCCPPPAKSKEVNLEDGAGGSPALGLFWSRRRTQRRHAVVVTVNITE
jgi:hypothetical protein